MWHCPFQMSHLRLTLQCQLSKSNLKRWGRSVRTRRPPMTKLSSCRIRYAVYSLLHPGRQVPRCINIEFLPVLQVGRGQRPPASRVGHSGKTEEEPHGDGQVDEPAGEPEQRATGEEPSSRGRESAAGEGAVAPSELPGLRKEKLQPGLGGNPGAARWRATMKKRHLVVSLKALYLC